MSKKPRKQFIDQVEGRWYIVDSRQDEVRHPSHYNSGKIETWDAIEDWGYGEGFFRGTAIKYLARAGKKDPSKELEDVEKAREYVDKEIARLKKKVRP